MNWTINNLTLDKPFILKQYLFEILAALHKRIDLGEDATAIKEPLDLAEAVVGGGGVVVRFFPRFAALDTLV